MKANSKCQIKGVYMRKVWCRIYPKRRISPRQLFRFLPRGAGSPSLGLGRTDIDGLAVVDRGDGAVNTVESAGGTPSGRDLGDAQSVVFYLLA